MVGFFFYSLVIGQGGGETILAHKVSSIVKWFAKVGVEKLKRSVQIHDLKWHLGGKKTIEWDKY